MVMDSQKNVLTTSNALTNELMKIEAFMEALVKGATEGGGLVVVGLFSIGTDSILNRNRSRRSKKNAKDQQTAETTESKRCLERRRHRPACVNQLTESRFLFAKSVM